MRQGADLHMVHLMPLPLSFASGNPDLFWFYLSVASLPCSSGQNPESRKKVVQ